MNTPTILRVPRALREGHEETAVGTLLEYFGAGPHRTPYTGAHFETIGHSSGLPTEPTSITALDLVAVSMLSVNVPASASIRILGEDSAHISALLSHVPPELALVDASPDYFLPDHPIGELWALLRSYDNVGPTITSKLLARKRPLLVPIYDEVVRHQYGIRDSRGFWAAMQRTIDEYNLWEHAITLRKLAGLSSIVSPLRIIDIVVWMSGQRNHQPDEAVEWATS